MPTELEETTSTLPPAGEEHATAASEDYGPVLAATRDLSSKFPLADISKAVLLLEIERLAREELDKIKKKIGKQVKPWNLDRYHRRVLLNPSATADGDTPDVVFSRHAGTKPRVILRLTGKVILSKVKSLLSAPELILELISTFNTIVLHEQIEAYIKRWDEGDVESEVAEEAEIKNQKKRQRGGRCFAVGNVPC